MGQRNSEQIVAGYCWREKQWSISYDPLFFLTKTETLNPLNNPRGRILALSCAAFFGQGHQKSRHCVIGYLRDALIREGDPVEVIASEGRCFSLVTMAETSRSKLRQSADVAYGVLRKAENSVLVMRGA